MNPVIIFFLIQTTLLVVWFRFPLPTFLDINFNYLLYDFCKYGLYQFLNIGFIFSLLIQDRKRFLTMFDFVKRRRHWLSFLIFPFYLSLATIFLLPASFEFLYSGGIIVVTVLLIFFPRFFPKNPIKNPSGFKEDDFNFQLLGKWGQRLPVINPQAGIVISGLQGSGKTASGIAPILATMIHKRYAGILYDFDFAPSPNKDFSLTHLAYRCLQEFGDENKSKFISINFQDVKTSSRFNPIDPIFIQDRKNLSHYLETFLLNLNPEEGEKRDFWYKNTYILLQSIVIFLNNQYPSCCTLPHAFMMGLQPFDKLLPALKTDAEASLYVSAAEDAFTGSPEQFTGVISSFKILLLKMLDKHICWVLGANEVPVIVNDPINPLIVCLGNTPTQTSFTSPILVMIAAVLLGNMYAHGRNKSFLMIDELPMFKLPNLSEVPATARKYGISTVVALQDMTQLREKYTAAKAEVIQNIFGNYFFGRSSLEGAEHISKFMGKIEKEVTSTSKSGKQTSVNTSQKEVPLITPQEAMTLKTGQFVGKVIHPSGGFFKMKLKPIESYHKRFKHKYFQPLPIIHNDVDIEANFIKLEEEVLKIVNQYIRKTI